MSIGIESADPVVLGRISRKGTPEDGREALRNARASDVRTRALMMVGLPGTRGATGTLDRGFIEAGLFDGLAITVFTPVPGCAVAADPRRYGCRIIEDRMQRSLCMYGPEGRNAVLPTIAVDGLTDVELAREMERTVDAAEATSKLGAG